MTVQQLVASTADASRWHAGTTRAGPGRVGSAVTLVVLGVAVLAGAATAVHPAAALGAAGGVTLAAAVWVRPAIAAYLVIGVTPLVVGIDRGVVMPVFRPNEALEMYLGAVLAVRGLVRLRSGGLRFPRLSHVELSILLLALTSSVVPLLTMALRRREITADDLLSSLALWKLAGIYLIVRCSVRSGHELRRCLYVSVAAASVVAVVGILQGLDLLGIRQLLAGYYAPFGDTRYVLSSPRGGSTLSLPAATADLMVLNLALVAGLWVRDRRRAGVWLTLSALFVAATLAAGEFSSAIGLALGALAIVVVTGSLDLLAVFGALALTGSVAVWPVIARRLQDFESAYGIPVSWVGRLRNLRTYFWPHLESYGNVLLGVRPSARVRVDAQATGWVWIESGYTWLMWAGGIPLLLSYLFFVHASVVQGWQVARGRADAAGVAATAATVGIVVVTTLMVFDPHLTYRGSADEFFALTALTAVAARWPVARQQLTQRSEP
jgi:hypothetical protein